MKQFDVIVIGGGPAGSAAAIELAWGGSAVAIVEKKPFPREVLCGEFLSHEVVTAVRRFGLHDPFLSLHPVRIRNLFFSVGGSADVHPLGFEAYALKRSLLDHLLVRKAKEAGATVIQPAEVRSIVRDGEFFAVECSRKKGRVTLRARNVIAAYGKQNPLDKALHRRFASRRSGLLGIKVHVPRSIFRELPDDTIMLFSVPGIYCGVNRVSHDEATVCFLMDGRRHQDPGEALRVLLRKDQHFRTLFRSDFSLQFRTGRVYGAGNIFLGKRDVVENGIYLAGDAAGMIAPLSGDGIGMALEGGRLAARVLLAGLPRSKAEKLYIAGWRELFRSRVMLASFVQWMAMSSIGSAVMSRVIQRFPRLMGEIIRGTRNRQNEGCVPVV